MASMSDASVNPVGRPRDLELESRILSATQDLLIEIGYGGTTIAAVAERAHCGKSAIYLGVAAREVGVPT